MDSVTAAMMVVGFMAIAFIVIIKYQGTHSKTLGRGQVSY